MAKLKVKTTITYVATTVVDGEKVTAADVRRIKRDLKNQLGRAWFKEDIADEIGLAVGGDTTARQPVITVEEA